MGLALAAWLAPAPAPAAEDPFEDNDVFTQAAELPGFDTYALEAGDEDWFWIRNVGPGTLHLDLDFTPVGSTQLRLFWWNAAPDPSSGCVPGSGCLGADLMDAIRTITSEADYLLQVKRTNDLAAVPYVLTVENEIAIGGDDADDGGAGNDSLASPLAVGPNDRLESRRAFDPDFYAVNVIPGVFTADLSIGAGTSMAPELEIYDQSGTRICSTPAGNCVVATGDPQRRVLRQFFTEEQPLFVAVVPGERNYTVGTADREYTLDLDLPTRWVTDLEYGPVRFGSITLADLDGDGLEEVLVGTSKGLDEQLNEVVPAGLVCLNSDGSVRWSTEFPAFAGPDPFNGKTYQTTSVSSTPAVGDVDGDGQLDVVVGVGGDLGGEAQLFGGAGPDEVPGQPGDLGGVYAVDGATGAIKWFHQSLDAIGGPTNMGDGRPDGVFGTPLIAELDGTPGAEVVFGAWDRHVWLLDGITGAAQWSKLLHDTVLSSPALADVDGDGVREILLGADITENPGAGTLSGGVLHVLEAADGAETIPGFDQMINVNPTNPAFDPIYGKFEEQVLWSSPTAADWDGDEELEIAHGTSFAGNDPSLGRFVRVWNHDGTVFPTDEPAPTVEPFPTSGQTFASVLFADLEGDGSLELIAADTTGRVVAWRDDGTQVFETLTTPWCSGSCDPDILSSPLAVDLDGDDDLEILYSQGSQVVVVDTDGAQLSSPDVPFLAMGGFRGSPAVGDIDADGVLDIVAAGGLFTGGDRKSSVFSWRWELASAPLGRFARRQFAPEPASAGLAACALGAAALVARSRLSRRRASSAE